MKEPKGFEILIRGTVQGVGFRPFVYNLASRLGIRGSVSNTADGVLIRAQAEDGRLLVFLEQLRSEAPPLSRITSMVHQPLETAVEEEGFAILTSQGGGVARTSIPPDIALCRDCLTEMRDPGDRRHNYPFINCTNCGPRFSIVESIPYDRPKTSMKVFPMCPFCQEQYSDPGNRRFHAQPNACPVCGPQLSYHDRSGRKVDSPSPLAETARALAAGKVLALRGLGGFHLAVDATSLEAVQTLRDRKGRPDKPLAVMMADLDTVRRHCLLTVKTEQLLTSTVQPIVLLPKSEESTLAANLAPHIGELGVMLPYTPLHHLLFTQPDCPSCLVMTSGNSSGEPICTGNEEALAKLSHICDAYLLHNREIVTRVDDSVVRLTGKRQQIYRRARGYVPAPVELAWKLPQIMGCGGGLKSTFCLAREKTAYPSQHIGDLFNLESFDFYCESVEHLKKVFQIEPEIVACDLHPDYMSSRYAEELGLPLYRVQHHHAHAVAVMAEHGLSEPVLAVIMDGTGYGSDKTIWGGELLLAGLTSFRRLGHLQHLHLPGGDAAAVEPWRMGISALYTTFGPDFTPALPPALLAIPAEKRDIVCAMLKNNFNAPLTSSCGRLFDAVAALLGVRQRTSYEGQAAIELESLARRAATSTWYDQIPEIARQAGSFVLCKEGGNVEICSSEFVKLLNGALHRDTPRAEVALRFHAQLAAAIGQALQHLTEATGVRQVVLAGGCMQNSLLLEGLFHTLAAAGFDVFTGEQIPINDGGISLGQTITGGLQHVSRDTHEGYQG